MAGKYEKRRPKRNKNGLQAVLVIFLLLLLIIAVMFAVKFFGQEQKPNIPSESTAGTDAFIETTLPPETTVPPTTEETTGPTEPYVMSTASIGASGDVLLHNPVIKAGLFGKEYNFDNIFTYAADYFKRYDYMVANLEVTLAGPDKPYQGYPQFNSPDAIAEALKNAGVDMLLTANNHTYDMGHDGMMRTMQVLQDLELDYLGTRSSEEDTVYQIQEINGIKIGMVCYTYNTISETNGRLSLNGLPLKEQDRQLVNSFDYTNLTPFYEEFEGVVEAMRNDGAEAIVAFLHWGYEYHLSPIKYQKNMAQKLCDMGVDVIVGGHPHVLEPFETLTSENGNTTYCLYSTGNLISNQRRQTLNTVDNENYTEDGIIFGVTFQKWSDGKVEVCAVEATPTWVAKEYRDGRNRYTVVPLDTTVEDWKNTFDLKDASYLAGSYKRTMSVIGEGINAAREAFGQEAYILKLD